MRYLSSELAWADAVALSPANGVFRWLGLQVPAAGDLGCRSGSAEAIATAVQALEVIVGGAVMVGGVGTHS